MACSAGHGGWHSENRGCRWAKLGQNAADAPFSDKQMFDPQSARKLHLVARCCESTQPDTQSRINHFELT